MVGFQRFSHLKVNSQSVEELFVSPAAIKFTVMWLLMSVFFLCMGKIESTDAAEDTGEEFPLNGTPVVETPSVVTGTPFDFAPL